MLGGQSVREQLVTWVDRAIAVQDGAVRAHVASVRGGTPDADPAGVVSALESQYLATVSGAGAAAGGAASVPGVGTGLAIGLSVAETVAFLDATALFTVAVAQACGRDLSDLPRRRAVFLVALLGDDALALVDTADGGPEDAADTAWGTRLVSLPDRTIDRVNRLTEKWLLTRFGPRQGLLVLGRLVPFGIGAAVGAAGNAVTAKGVIARIRAAFAAPHAPRPALPSVLPQAGRALEAAVDATPPGDATPGTDATPSGDATPGTGTTPVTSPLLRPSRKYLPLFTELAARPEQVVELTVDEVDAVLGGNLPATARRNPAWWGNEPATQAPQARAWLAAGLAVDEVDLESGTVRLKRAGVAPASAG